MRLDEIARTAVDNEKTGIFTGGYAINPVNEERIPTYLDRRLCDDELRNRCHHGCACS